jgi:catechol 2,3-dioxygenase-like lactoylglutathione lyase family enzyme
VPDPLRVSAFSHVTIRVSDPERSVPFYRDVLGLEPVFDVELSGGGLDAVTGTAGAAGRMVGLLVPGNGVMVELICFPQRSSPIRTGRASRSSASPVRASSRAPDSTAGPERAARPRRPAEGLSGRRAVAEVAAR